MWSRDLSKVKEIPSNNQSNGGIKVALRVWGPNWEGKKLYMKMMSYVKFKNIYKIFYKL